MLSAARGSVITSSRARKYQSVLPPPVSESMNLIRSLVLKGKLIIGDAAYCHRDICESIIDSSGDYLVTVKKFQRQPLRDVEQCLGFHKAFAPCSVKQERARRQTDTTNEKNRGRIETRTVTTTNIIDSKYLDWPDTQQLIKLERHTIEKGEVRQTTTCTITSLSRDHAKAEFLLKHLLGRWLIESRFYVLDAHLREDHC